MVLLHEEEEEPNGRLKEPTKCRGSSEPQKAHPTGEFVVVA